MRVCLARGRIVQNGNGIKARVFLLTCAFGAEPKHVAKVARQQSLFVYTTARATQQQATRGLHKKKSDKAPLWWVSVSFTGLLCLGLIISLSIQGGFYPLWAVEDKINTLITDIQMSATGEISDAFTSRIVSSLMCIKTMIKTQ